MKKYNIIRKILLAVALTLTITGFSQQFPTGGYQGGTHGNIKVKEWTGAVDDKWNEPGNWCPATVPGPQDEVVINPVAPNMPEVKAAGLSCKSLTLQPGATLTIKPGYVLTVNGNEME